MSTEAEAVLQEALIHLSQTCPAKQRVKFGELQSIGLIWLSLNIEPLFCCP